MARPRKSPAEQRRHVVNIRLTDAELAQLKTHAAAAGMPFGRYARETVLGKRPRARPAQLIIFQKLLYELQSAATNFQQLADATGEEVYARWARYTGGQLVEQLLGRNDLAELIEAQIEPLNMAGYTVNRLAHMANSGHDVPSELQGEAFEAMRAALEPLHEASVAPTTANKDAGTPSKEGPGPSHEPPSRGGR